MDTIMEFNQMVRATSQSLEGYVGHIVTQVEKGHKSIIVYTGTTKDGFSFLKLDIKPTSAITADVTAEQLRADMYVAISRRGDWVRLEKYGTRIYFNDLIRDQGKLFKDMFNLKGEIQYGISIND